MIGQRDQHRLEHTHLLRCRSLLRGKPEGQFAKPDIPHQLAREIVTKQVNAGGIGGAYSSGKFHMSLIRYKLLSPLDAGLLPGASWLNLGLSLHRCSKVILSF